MKEKKIYINIVINDIVKQIKIDLQKALIPPR